MIKREAKFGLILRHWLKANPQYSCAIELKQTLTDSIPFSCLKESQINYGLALDSDVGALIRIQGGSGEPDYIYGRKMPAFVAIKYPRFFCLIRIRDFYDEKLSSDRKSLTSKRAKEIAFLIT